jgi:hydrogenase maturation protease
LSDERLLIIGLGNPLMGDDGVGIQVVNELRESDLPEYVDVIDGGTPGVGLIDLMSGYSRVIVVDAVRGEDVFKYDENPLSLDNCSLHEMELTSVLRLMKTLGIPIPEITIVGIPAVNIAPGIGLSEECRRYMQEAISLIKRLRGQVLQYHIFLNKDVILQDLTPKYGNFHGFKRYFTLSWTLSSSSLRLSSSYAFLAP